MMARAVRAILLFLFFVLKEANSDEGILCTEQFCRNYGFDVGCSTPAPHCRINNATHTGINLPSPTICNCCDFCLAFFLEGEPCSIGGPGDGNTVGRCGPGLTCVAEDEENRCRRMDSACHREQDDYDRRHSRGETGFLEERPRCDHKGLFSPASCVSAQTCFCQSETGERIFGEAEYRDTNVLLRMQCGCSRRNYDIQKNIGSGIRAPVIGPRCTQDGGYQPVQCDGRRCHCVDRITGTTVGSHHIDLDTHPISDLPCYDLDLDIFTYLNFRDETENFNYTSPCELEQEELMQWILQSEEDGYIVDYFTTTQDCLPDGTDGRVSTNITDGRKTCITERYDQIENYTLMPDDEGYDTMHCKCALTSRLLRDRLERPVCCQNGNFRPVQCRRGLCYCVDENGRQVGLESSDVTKLNDCYTEDWRNC